MNEVAVMVESNRAERKLPKRDWILLPLISLLTIVFLVGATEIAAREMIPASTSTLKNCLTIHDPLRGIKGIPNSQCFEESFETGHVDYKFDALGYRNPVSLTAKLPGTFRIVMAGSSVAFGQWVRAQKDVAPALQTNLARLTGRDIEVYNEGMEFGWPRSVLLRFNDLTAAKPNLIVWLLTPYDVEHAGQISATMLAPQSAIEKIKDAFKFSRAGVIMEYFLFRSPSSPVKAHLLAAGSSDFLHATVSPELKQELFTLDQYVGRLEELSKAAGIPVVAALVPTRSQAAMISMGHWPPDYDPYELGRQVQAVVQNHGGVYIDILPDFQHVPNAEQHYFPMANHPDADCDALIAKFLAAGMANDIPALRVHRQTTDSKKGL